MQNAHPEMLELALKWQSEVGQHCDRLFINQIELAKAICPADPTITTLQLSQDQQTEHRFAAGELVAACDQQNILGFDRRQMQQSLGARQIQLQPGRFYPQALAANALDCEPNDFTPMRLVEINDDQLVVDKNHPLSTYPLELGIKHCPIRAGLSAGAAQHLDIAIAVTGGGPGMQLPYRGRASDFYHHYPFRRDNEQDDADFYRQARLVQHLDDVAIEQVTALHAGIMQPGIKVLDLMSSHLSHLPAVEPLEVVGLGMNQQELEHNPRLTQRVIHDLNKKPELPFADASFDVAICTSSIEYLIDPLAVFDELARILKPGSILMVTFSDRWFAGKEIILWSELHPFERQGLVLDYFIRSGKFEDLHTESVRGLPRPVGDIHSNLRQLADPVFAVWGTASQGGLGGG